MAFTSSEAQSSGHAGRPRAGERDSSHVRDVRDLARTTEVTLTLPTDVLAAATAQVAAGQAPSLSAYVAKALAAQVAVDQEHDGFLAFLERLDKELGTPSDEDFAWARRFISQ
jgi:hypothetical protein